MFPTKVIVQTIWQPIPAFARLRSAFPSIPFPCLQASYKQQRAEATVSVDQGLKEEGQDIGELFCYTL